MIEFSNRDGTKRYVYDYDALVVGQAELAGAVLMFRAEQSEKRARTFQEVELSGGADANIKACAILLLEKTDDDQVRPFNRQRVKFAEEFLSGLSIAQHGRLQEVIVDFLERSGRGQLALLLFSKEYLLLAKMMATPEVAAPADAATSSPSASELSDSTTQENSTAG